MIAYHFFILIATVGFLSGVGLSLLAEFLATGARPKFSPPNLLAWATGAIAMLTALLIARRIAEPFWLGYSIFAGALITSIYTDLRYMVISRVVSVYLVPIGVGLTYIGLLPLTPHESIAGCVIGYGTLWGIAWIFRYVTGRDGLGQGDIDLAAMIGSFVGLLGIATTIFMASVSGALFGILCIIAKKATVHTRIPFGPFLAFGALVTILWPHLLTTLL